MSSKIAALSGFINAAPPGELSNVLAAIKTLSGDPNIIRSLESALREYNEEQFTSVKLPGSSSSVLISPFNRAEDGRYYDIDAGSSWDFDHLSQKVSDVRSHTSVGGLKDLVASTYKSLKRHTDEHYPNATIGVFPENDNIHILTASSKYSPPNFYNGRYRASYSYTPSSGSLTGNITVDVHYYEDGNVRLLTSKKVNETVKSGGGVVQVIASVERRYQEELNRGFGGLSEGAFRSLRRQLPVTRVKVEWERAAGGGYRVGQDIGGARR